MIIGDSMDKYIIGIDLDGTLLVDHKEISDFNKKVINKVRELGHKVVIATGRPSFGAMPFYKELKLDTPLIIDNGSSVISNNGEVIFESKMPLELLKRLFYENLDLIDSSFCNGKINGYIYNKNDIFREILISMNCSNFIEGPLDKILEEEVHSFMCIARPEKTDELVDRFNSYEGISARVWKGEVHIIEVYQSSLSKLTALKQAAEYLGINFENSIAFGDDVNDIEMIQGCSFGYALSNGVDIVKEIAYGVTKYPNDKNGVGMQLVEFFKLNIETII